MTKLVLLRSTSWPTLPHISPQKKREEHSAEMKKTLKYNSVERTPKRTFWCSHAGWIVHWPPLELCCHLKKKKHCQRSNAIVERGPFFASCRTKTMSVKRGECLCFLVSHRTNKSRKKMLVGTERCNFWDQRRGHDARPSVQIKWPRPEALLGRM